MNDTNIFNYVIPAIQDLKKEDLLVTEQRYRARGGKSSLLFQIRKP